jgi:hypothetical protein
VVADFPLVPREARSSSVTKPGLVGNNDAEVSLSGAGNRSQDWGMIPNS